MSDVSVAIAGPLVCVEEHSDGVVCVRLNNPPVNTLSIALLDDLARAAESLSQNPSAKVVVLAGREKAFAAGGDIADFGGPKEAVRSIGHVRAAIEAVASIPRPVLAAIRGVALGGGLELAMACDFRVASDSAQLGHPEILLGIIPGGGGTQRLPRLVGPVRAKEIIWSGRQVSAKEALAIGLVDRIAPAADVEATAIGWAKSLASGPVVAMSLAKQAIDRGLEQPLAAGLDLEREAFVAAFATEDAATGIQSFRQRGMGSARFRGR
jgi:enoyl-CoA hydratase/carnithine racemase